MHCSIKKQNEQPDEKLSEAVVYGDNSRDETRWSTCFQTMQARSCLLKANLLSYVLIIFHCKRQARR